MLATYRLLHRFFLFFFGGGGFFIYKHLHIEPFNYTIKSVCFDFGSTNVGSSVIKTGRSEGSLLTYLYWFWCHYPLITYLSPQYIIKVDTRCLMVSTDHADSRCFYFRIS